MRQKLLVEKKLEKLKYSAVLIENMISRTATREEFLQAVETVKNNIEELRILISNETEEFN